MPVHIRRRRTYTVCIASLTDALARVAESFLAHDVIESPGSDRQQLVVHVRVHEVGLDVQVLDDGAIRFVDPHGETVDRVQPGCAQPPGDASQLPAGKYETTWRGGRMDLDLAVDALRQRSRRCGDVPAVTQTDS